MVLWQQQPSINSGPAAHRVSTHKAMVGARRANSAFATMRRQPRCRRRPPGGSRGRRMHNTQQRTGQATGGLVAVAPGVHHFCVAHQACTKRCERARRMPLWIKPEAAGTMYKVRQRNCLPLPPLPHFASHHTPVSGAPRRAAAVQKPDMKAKSNPARSISRALRPSWQQGPWHAGECRQHALAGGGRRRRQGGATPRPCRLQLHV